MKKKYHKPVIIVVTFKTESGFAASDVGSHGGPMFIGDYAVNRVNYETGTQESWF